MADAVYNYDQTWDSIKETASSLPKTIDDWIVHTPLDKQGQFFGEIGWSIPIGRAFELAFTRALSAARWVDDVVPNARGPAPRNGGRIYSASLTSRELSTLVAKPISAKRLQQMLGRARLIDSSNTRIVRAAASEVPDVPGMKYYGWVCRDGAGRILRDHRGRYIIKITDDGLSSVEQAAQTIGHEMHHIREALAGAGASEAAAEGAGELMLRKLLEHLRRGG